MQAHPGPPKVEEMRKLQVLEGGNQQLFTCRRGLFALVLFSLLFPLSASLSIQQATLGRVSQRNLSDGLIGNHTSRREEVFTHLHRGSLTVAEKIRGDYYYYFNYAPFFVSFSLKAESRWRCASVCVSSVCQLAPQRSSRQVQKPARAGNGSY